MNLWIWAILAVVFNILDSVTTEVGLHRLPKNLRGKEANPIMDRLMKVHPRLAEYLKQIAILILVGVCLYQEELSTLVFMAVALGLVVINNTYLIVVRLTTKRSSPSPLWRLAQVLKIPQSLTYLFAVAIFLGTAWAIAYFIT